MILAQPCESETQEPEVCINLLYTVHTPPPSPPTQGKNKYRTINDLFKISDFSTDYLHK